MDTAHRPAGVLDPEPTASQEALRLIVEVFRDGHEAAAGLRETAARLTPGQLRSELETIEQTMLSQICMICDQYQIQEMRVQRN